MSFGGPRVRTSPEVADGGTSDAVEDSRMSAYGGDDGGKSPRLPRWTRQEILVLIQGKRVAENRVRTDRARSSGFGSPVEPKWTSISCYCNRHGVYRGPVQCRKRWSNLSGDYRKIKEWEARVQDEAESFWLMRNDMRREKKLPGFFDREVYDALDGNTSPSDSGVPVLALALASAPPPPLPLDPLVDADGDSEALFDSGRSACAEVEDGSFSEFEPDDITTAVPISEMHYEPVCQPEGDAGGRENGPQVSAKAAEVGSGSHDRSKRKRHAVVADEETTSLHNQLVDILERNGRMLSDQLEAQNAHFQLCREQRKEHTDSMISVLNKLTDVLVKIADKL